MSETAAIITIDTEGDNLLTRSLEIISDCTVR